MSLQQIDPQTEFKTRVLIGYHKPDGRQTILFPVYVEAELHNMNRKGLEFSFGFEVWNTRRNDTCAWCHTLADIRPYLDELAVSEVTLARMAEVGERWRMNGLRAGCEHQRAEGWGKTELTLPSGEKKLSTWVSPTEHPEGVLCKPCPVCGYKFGSAWLHEDLPQEVIDEVKSWGENEVA